MPNITRFFILLLAAFSLSAFANPDRSHIWISVNFTTETQWQVEIATTPHLEIVRYVHINHRGVEIPVPRSAYEAIDQPFLSEVQLVAQDGSNNATLNVPALLINRNGQTIGRRVWHLAFSNNRYQKLSYTDQISSK